MLAVEIVNEVLLAGELIVSPRDAGAPGCRVISFLLKVPKRPAGASSTLRCFAFGELCEVIKQVGTGQQLRVKGHLETLSLTAADGSSGQVTAVIVSSVVGSVRFD